MVVKTCVCCVKIKRACCKGRPKVGRRCGLARLCNNMWGCKWLSVRANTAEQDASGNDSKPTHKAARGVAVFYSCSGTAYTHAQQQREQLSTHPCPQYVRLQSRHDDG